MRPIQPGTPQRLLFVTVSSLYLFLLLPLAVYLGNADEFSHGFLNVLSRIAPSAVAFWALVSLLVFTAPPPAVNYLLGVLAALLVCVYLQFNIFVPDYGVFDGSPIAWHRHRLQAVADAALWIVALAAGLRWAAWFHRYSLRLTALVSLLHIAGLAPYLFSSSNWLLPHRPKDLARLFEFSPDKNVIFLVLDGFSSPAFSALVGQSPEYQNRFEDFIYFRNAVSDFPSTLLSVPAILSGRPFDGSQPAGSYLKDVFGRQSLASSLESLGYVSALGTLQKFCLFHPPERCFGWSMAVRKRAGEEARREGLQVIDLALFRAAPQQAKRLVYSNDRWLLQRLYGREGKTSPLYDSQVAFADEVIEQVSAASARPAFKFIHLLMPHFPIRLDAECRLLPKGRKITAASYEAQSRCALRLAGRFLDRLKTLGIYHNSFIAVIADHGAQHRSALDYGLFDRKRAKERRMFHFTRALPLMLLKPPGRNAPFSISDAPALLSDLAKTVHTQLGIQDQLPGRDLLTLQENKPRQRIFRNLSLRWAMWKTGLAEERIENLDPYKITGHAWKMDSWERISP